MRYSNPLFSLKIITGIVCFAMVILLIVARLEGKRIDSNFLFPLLLLGSSLCIIYVVFKSIDRRLSDIEEKIGRKDK